ncbi:ATP synthase F1 subcomplex delta subunit [Clostridium cavendishii DSM 21758]|uniref:ATP synthase subunit delta n=1 Tax=Clostridium cavendishii DSM 21758 TaxID=1121302 RepID=A0A1M6U3S3_9CLOT|nr:F0F1 ATP synthase subunit delta [Clostridium cavendishii]SHK63836.1 ATP synthase F1 subcomplex delta subunit [Clostridium cavendishii DSM 21758]
MYEYLDKRYALALYEVAESKNKVDEYIQDLKTICDLISGNEDFYEVIKHPQISTGKKKDTLKTIFEGKIDAGLLSFLLILVEKDRILNLREILVQMEKIHLEKNNTLLAHIKSVIPLTEDESQRLTSKLEKKYNKKVILNYEIDKSIIGGLYVRVGNDVIDGTIISKLDEMKALMLRKE